MNARDVTDMPFGVLTHRHAQSHTNRVGAIAHDLGWGAWWGAPWTLEWESMGCWVLRVGPHEHLFCADDVGTDSETVVPALMWVMSQQRWLASWVILLTMAAGGE